MDRLYGRRKVGTYNANAPVFDSYADAEQANYLGKQGANQSALTNIAYQIGNSGGGSAGGDAELRILFIGTVLRKMPWSICPAF